MSEMVEQTVVQETAVPAKKFPSENLRKVGNVLSIIWQWIFFLRKVFFAIPVIYYTIKLAQYNSQMLPENVGLLLQADGSFLVEITKSLAVAGPAAITIGCLAMMFLSRKALYAWAISIFTLAVPILLLFSNIYPA